MSSAAARVLELFLQTPKQGVTGVTHVTGRLVTSESSAVTTVTPVTYQKQVAEERDVTGAQSGGVTPEQIETSFQERAAIIEYDGGTPRLWAEALARLDTGNPPSDVPLPRWRRFIDDCGRFLDQGWASRAKALGLGPLDLFGCDRERPFARIDHLGLLWLIKDGSIVELHRDRALFKTPGALSKPTGADPLKSAKLSLLGSLRLKTSR
jgi:hypothetical protein